MATVYSYVRFSHNSQNSGDSARRQTELREAWLSRNSDHVLDTSLRLADLGVSAFRGKNLDESKGDLGKFIALAKSGKIETPAILLLESMDRFSRLPPRKVLHILGEVVDAGVTVQTLDPEQTIDISNIDNMETLLPIVIYMQLASEQSKEKSRRLAQAWGNKTKMLAERGKPLTRKIPHWLDPNGWDGKQFAKVYAGKAKAIRCIYDSYINGKGVIQILDDAQKKLRPVAKTGKWTRTYIYSLLTDRSVIGEFSHKGRTYPNYFKPIISEDIFWQVQAILKQKQRPTGQRTKYCPLFSGLVYSARDKTKYHCIPKVDWRKRTIKNGKVTWSKSDKPRISRRLISIASQNKVAGKDPFTFDLILFEHIMVALLCDHLTALTSPGIENPGSQLSSLEAKLAEVKVKQEELGSLMVRSKKPLASFESAAGELAEQQDKLESAITQAKLMAVQTPLVDTIAKVRKLRKDKTTEGRHKMSAVIRQVVDRIDLLIWKSPTRNKTNGLVQVKLRDGSIRYAIISKDGCFFSHHLDYPDLQTITDKALDKVADKAQSALGEALASPTFANEVRKAGGIRLNRKTGKFVGEK